VSDKVSEAGHWLHGGLATKMATSLQSEDQEQKMQNYMNSLYIPSQTVYLDYGIRTF
jgi:hypothetical protein